MKRRLFALTLGLSVLLFVEGSSYFAVRRVDRVNRLAPVYGGVTNMSSAVARYMEIASSPRFDPDLQYDNHPPMRGDVPADNAPFLVSAYGDSYTYGQFVPDDACWTHLLQEALGARVLNMGVPGYGPGQAYLKLLKYYPRYPSKVVIFGLLPENINRLLIRIPNYYFMDASDVPVAKPRYAVRDGRVVLLPNPAPTFAALCKLLDPDTLRVLSTDDYWYVHDLHKFGYDRIRDRPRGFPYSYHLARIAYGILTAPPAEKNDWRPFYNDTNSEGMQILRYVLDEFLATAARWGFTPVIVMHRQRVKTLDEHAYLAPLLDGLRARGVLVVDAAAIFRRETRRGALRPEELFNPDEGHYSPLANRILAAKLAPVVALIRDGRLDDAREACAHLSAEP